MSHSVFADSVHLVLAGGSTSAGTDDSLSRSRGRNSARRDILSNKLVA